MVSASVCSNAVVLLLLSIHCLLALQLCVGVWFFSQCLVMLYLVYNVVFNNLAEEERAGCFTLTAFLLTFGYKCSVSLPYSGVSWSALSNCGISDHTPLHFGHFLFIAIKVNQFFCVSCLYVCQCTQTMNYLTTIIAIGDLF